MTYRARNCRPVRRRRQAGQLVTSCSHDCNQGRHCTCRPLALDGTELDQLLFLLQWLCLVAVIFFLTAAAVEFFP